MNTYLTIRNYHEKEIGMVFRHTNKDYWECNLYYDRNSWFKTGSTLDKILDDYPKSVFELKWYTEEEYRAMLAMEELIS